MLEILQFYVSGFWAWLGITIGLSIVARPIFGAVAAIIAIIRARA